MNWRKNLPSIGWSLAAATAAFTVVYLVTTRKPTISVPASADGTPRLHITLYSGGQPVRQWSTTDTGIRAGNSGCISFTDEKTHKPILLRGEYVVESTP